ncbi:hypothetical protein SDC9_127891 [bioreactor metagenome]|uniref:Uncharacterized protein n=1 Tax=bioreactor metagenome TaxID=1076179 RepID=A0A645CUM5_9ZZZZ
MFKRIFDGGVFIRRGARARGGGAASRERRAACRQQQHARALLHDEDKKEKLPYAPGAGQTPRLRLQLRGTRRNPQRHGDTRGAARGKKERGAPLHARGGGGNLRGRAQHGARLRQPRYILEVAAGRDPAYKNGRAGKLRGDRRGRRI